MAGIYVHIPFCKAKCRYCDFVSFPDKIGFAEGYMACVYREMAMREKELCEKVFDTLYIGGGTPSLIEPNLIAMLVAAAKKHFKLAENAEITIEINPGTIDENKVKIYKKCGINRFSIGLQTAIDSQLRELGRVHNLNDYVACTKLLSGENFSTDIMIGLKDQTIDDIEKSIEVAARFNSSHISMYALTPEDGTPIYTDYLSGLLPASDEVADMYESGVAKLKEFGFERYEVSNFAKSGRVSRHNLNYWRRGEYIGFGVSASSFINGTRFTNTFDLDEYYKCILTGKFPVIDSQEIDEIGCCEERIMLSLRTDKGLDLQAFQEEFGENFLERFSAAIDEMGEFVEVSDGFFRIKEEYLYVQNSIIVRFLQEL